MSKDGNVTGTFSTSQSKEKTLVEHASYQAGIRDGLKAASAMLALTEQEIRLTAGEMTAQEMRAVKAVLEWRRMAIIDKAEGYADPARK
ncbi:MAG: hypothetical protein AB7F35_00960 [Acetobacteraceae bacterium]